jgi:hypothetical protein
MGRARGAGTGAQPTATGDHFAQVFGSGRGSGRVDDTPEVAAVTATALNYDKLLPIDNRQELRDFAGTYGLRSDWHEPDEQGISATVHGSSFDNAMRAGDGLTYLIDSAREAEMNVVLHHEGQPIAVINLATLLAFACEEDAVATA